MHTTAMSNYIFTIDTLQFSKRLHKAGLGMKIAEEIAGAIKDSQTQSLEGLATKQDLVSLEQNLEKKFVAIDQKFVAMDRRFTEMNHRFDSVDQKFFSFEQKLEVLEYRLIIKMFAVTIAAVSIVTWLDKLIG